MPLLAGAPQALTRYNEIGVHYNLIANGVYTARLRLDPLSPEYVPYIVAGLIGFDMRRQMGTANPYLANGFSGKLSTRLFSLRSTICTLPVEESLATADFERHSDAIQEIYNSLAQLRAKANSHFHVGTTKILHWLYPKLFLMVDRNAAAAFRDNYGIGFARGTQPGYSSQRYLECLRCAQAEIRDYGIEGFLALEVDRPIARVLDKDIN